MRILPKSTARREQADLHLGEIEFGQILDHEFAMAEVDRLAKRALAGQCVDLADRKFSLAQYLQHGFADDACGADNSDIKFLTHCFIVRA